MKKKYYIWIVFAALVFFINLMLFIGTLAWHYLLAGFVWCGVFLFISYRRFMEYQEQRAEYEARMKAMEAFTKAAEKVSND